MARFAIVPAVFIAAGLAGLAGLAACDPSGIHGLGRRRDALVPCEVDALGRIETISTWLRSTDDGTEVFLLGKADPLAVVEPGHDACFGHGFIRHDSSTQFEFGSYTLDDEGHGQAVHEQEYLFAYQPDRSILDRDGSLRLDLAEPVDRTLDLSRDGSSLVLALDGEPRRLTSLGQVVEAVDVNTQAGAEAVFRLFNLPLLSSQTRLLGFGSAGMTQYIGLDAEFVGTVRNRFTVTVEALLDPNTTISYFQLEDLTGIVVDGLQHTDVDTSGEGSMNGVLSFVMRGTGGATDVVIRGALDYEGLIIGNGVAAGGGYTLTIEGVTTPYAVSYQLAANVDLRDVLPTTPGE